MNVYTHLDPDQIFVATAPQSERRQPWTSPKCRIVIRPGFLKLLCEADLDRYQDFVDADRGETVARSRTTRTAVLTAGGGESGPRIYIKSYSYLTWKESARAAARNTWLRPSRARREWTSLLHLLGAGVGAVEPIAYGECRRLGGLLRSCFLVTLEEPGFLPLQEIVPRSSGQDRRDLASALGRYTKTLHEAGFTDGNYRFRNLLARRCGLRWEFRNLDSPKGRIYRGSPSAHRREADLVSLDADARDECTRAERLRFLHAYLDSTPRPQRHRTARRIARRSTALTPTT